MSRYDYTSLDRVKRIIRSVSGDPSIQKKVHFSDSHSLPKKYSTNVGDGMLLGVTIADNYVGFEHWMLQFTSSSAFKLYRGEDELVTDGSGTVSSQFVSSSKIITINTSDWTGTHQTGDKFKFNTESNISNADADQFITDAEDIVNSMLAEYIGSSQVPYTTSVPTQVATGTAYIAAFLIYSSIYSSTNQSDIPEFINRWYRIGANMISAYIETIPARLTRYAVNVPRFVGREPLFDFVGVKDAAGIGVAMGDAHGKVEAQDLEYDKFYNTEEGGD